jgi:arylsulfatase A-like enzyme
VIKPGATTKQVGITMDWTATFRGLTGLPVDSNGEDGISLFPTLNSPDEIRDRTLFWRRRPSERRKKVRGGRAVRNGNWKLITFADGDQHLFNLADDPSESNDIVNQKPELVKQLQAKIDQWNDSM